MPPRPLPEVQVLIATALWAETLPLLRRVRAPRAIGAGLILGRMAGVPVALAHVGVGPAAAARSIRRALARCDAARVLSVGTCGALVDGLRPGAVLGAAALLGQPAEGAFLSPAGLPSAVVATVSHPVEDRATRDALARQGATVCEMEAAAVAHAAAPRPFGALKVVSDLAGAELPGRLRLPRRLRRVRFQARAWRMVDGPLAAALEAWLPALVAQTSRC